MAVINDPNTAANVAQVGAVSTLTTQNPLHISGAAIPYGTAGHYKLGVSSGIMAAALGANSEIFQFRWSHASLLAVITKLHISASVSTTFFAAGVPMNLDLIRSSAWSVAGTGGASPTLGTTLKARTGMGSSSGTAGDIRIATTAALGAGTKTLEANSMANVVAACPITASLNGLIIPAGTVLLEPHVGDGGHPIILGGAGGGANSEGFSIRCVAIPATGTWQFSIFLTWAEVTAY